MGVPASSISESAEFPELPPLVVGVPKGCATTVVSQLRLYPDGPTPETASFSSQLTGPGSGTPAPEPLPVSGPDSGLQLAGPTRGAPAPYERRRRRPYLAIDGSSPAPGCPRTGASTCRHPPLLSQFGVSRDLPAPAPCPSRVPSSTPAFAGRQTRDARSRRKAGRGSLRAAGGPDPSVGSKPPSPLPRPAHSPYQVRLRVYPA